MMRAYSQISPILYVMWQRAKRLWESKYVTETLNLVFALGLALLVGRVYTYWLTGAYGTPVFSILRGVGSDYFFATLLAGMLTLIPVVWIRDFLVVLFLYLMAGNIEHIVINGANLSYNESSELLETQFLLGSGLSATLLWKFSLLMASFTAGMELRPYIRVHLRKKMIAALVVLVLLPSGEAIDSDWYEYNIIESNAIILNYIMVHKNAPKSVVTLNQIRKVYHLDMDGERFTHSPIKKPNVLIVTIEALSAEHMRRGWTPILKERTESALYYENYIAPNRITVNGHYAMLCGDYPGLDSRIRGNDSDKINKVNWRSKPVMCLPRIMQQEGYNTYYVQATNTNYRNERKFMRLLGFHHILDDANFPIQGQANAGWGPIDRVVFKNAMLKISEVSQRKNPWFMMIMTEGTHEPFTVPKNCDAKKPGKSKEQNTFRCMDAALNNFLDWLGKMGILENTLVIVTSDESIPDGRKKKWLPQVLDNNHGFLMVLTPDKVVARKRDFFMHPDLLVSILDYIDAPDRIAQQDFGRSIFRDYSKFRPLYFSVAYLNIFHMMPDANHLITCFRTRDSYRKSYLPEGKLFDGEYEYMPVSPAERTTARDISYIIEHHLARPVKNESIPKNKQGRL